ncbi:cytochrome c biogenesis CcdA family protein [Lentibacter sp. XHP0401]|jgi:cytochrome c-type biogenesis protein|uniref:cytochrome c biogenesis CcdA family protein n=1 Tax=Lentibacter sp. XHP0401 TaxID=2984334 RepID=UPI0021E7B585|nr:cytochrome c biogenesis protein CcdA [Lentibacter sp. XHP0401]MCV2891678.1 cytochrome c biogenesis protein CcdA [Lentibacter sp. XHP0401]
MLGEITYWGAALAGFVAFFTPCILPMVPFYLSYMAGISMSELRSDGDIAPGAQKRLVISAIMFALGVTTIFMLMGMGATALGTAFAQWKGVLTYVAAAVIFVFGLHFLGVIRIGFLYREARMESKADPSTVFGAYVMGLAFGFGWSACVGPVLASILMVASVMGEVWRGGLLLAFFGIGMTAPFVVAALFAKPFLSFMARFRKYQGHVEKVMGVMLIVFAILIATNTVNVIANWMLEVFPSFQSLG